MAVSYNFNQTSQPVMVSKEGGQYRRFVSTALCEGLTGSGNAKLKSAVDKLESDGYTYGTVSGTFANLYLYSLTPRMVPGEIDKCYVDIEYRAANEVPGIGVFKVQSSLQQVQTQVDRYGLGIVLQHTYPSSDLDYPLDTLYQGGNLTVDEASFVISTEKLIRLTYPIQYSYTWLGTVNSTRWQGAPAGQWKCTRCDPILWDASTSPDTYMVYFDFEWRYGGWQPEAVFIDGRDGKPPANLVSGLGYKTISWNPSKNYNAVFPTNG